MRLLRLRLRSVAGQRWEQHRAVLEHARPLVVLQHLGSWHPVNGRRDDERRALKLLDRVDVVLDDSVDEALVEAVCGAHHDVQLSAGDWERALSINQNSAQALRS